MQESHILKRQAIKKTMIDLIGSTNEVQDPKLIFNSLFFTKQAFYHQVEIYKRLSTGLIIVHICFFCLRQPQSQSLWKTHLNFREYLLNFFKTAILGNNINYIL